MATDGTHRIAHEFPKLGSIPGLPLTIFNGAEQDMKGKVEFGKFGALCPVAVFLGLPVKKVRRLRDMGLIRLPGGRTRPEDLTEDWQQHAHRLEERPAAPPADRWVAPAPTRARLLTRARGGAGPSPKPIVRIAASYELWQAAQGGQLHSQR